METENKRVLVTGGAGYIGSIATKRLIDAGYSVISIDNLSKGLLELVDKRAEFHEVELCNEAKLEEIFSSNRIDYVIHFASYKAVGESMKNAVKYSDNIKGSINLLNAMVKHNVKKIIFSSSAAVYGTPNTETIDETTKTDPVNFYGFTKLKIEEIIKWYHKIHNISYIAFRYFNVAGDELKYVDPAAENVFPIIMETINETRKEFTIFGETHKTKDGTCIRDYIDVRDLVDAHILALNKDYCGPLNLGSGKGYSVKELICTFKEVTGIDFPVKIGDARKGDPAALIASSKSAEEKLGWIPKHTLKDMVKSTYEAYMHANHQP